MVILWTNSPTNWQQRQATLSLELLISVELHEEKKKRKKSTIIDWILRMATY